MLKIISASAVMSLVVCSATSAGAVPSASGVNDLAASEIVQVKRGSEHASGAPERDQVRRSDDFRQDYGLRHGYGYGDYGWGGGSCTSSWVLLCH